ncbi:MAG: hypothetical protein ACOX6T_03185 [Myxococcales bacterium]|jgi:hypothetical protein
MKRALSLAALLLAGCATLSPRFPQDVAASFAREEMRRLDTVNLQVYYPARHAEAAMRIAGRLGRCATELRKLAGTQGERRFLVFLTEADFNNAYVQPVVLGYPQQMVVPLHMSLEVFDLYDLGTTSNGDVSCHEAVHYVDLENIRGFWRGLNWFFGGLLTPQSFKDPWFTEGLATFFEGRLGPPVGRPHSPFWRAGLESGIAVESGELDAGSLSPYNRKAVPYGGAYLVGMGFVGYLARTYGEENLWKLIDKQGSSVFSPLGVTLRFKSVYGKSIGALFDDYTAELRASLRERKRPASQRVLVEEVGFEARMATAPGAPIALIAEGRDSEVRLEIREPDGRLRIARSLTKLLPFRPWIVASPEVVSGMSFTADGRWLYLVSADIDDEQSFEARLWKVDTRDGSVVRTWSGLRGVGGCVSPDGRSYVYVRIEGDTGNLVRLDLKSGATEQLTRFKGRAAPSAPACSPDGTRVAFSRKFDHGFDLFVREADGTVRRLTSDGRFNYQPRWIDDRRLVFLREINGRGQAHVFDLEEATIAPVTDAPFLAFDAAPAGDGQLVFLNREGWGWSLDAAPIAPRGELVVQALAAVNAMPLVSPEPPLEVERDEPYSQLDGLFLPTLHVPFLLVLPGEGGGTRFLGALSLVGSDRLGFHTWALNVSYDTADRLPSFSLGYGNYLAAPWLIDLNAAYVQLDETSDRELSIGATRSFWTSPVRIDFLALDRRKPGFAGAQRFIGPGVQASYGAGASTVYGGLRRALTMGAGAHYYLRALGSRYDLADVRGQIGVALPPPLLKRSAFELGVVGRALLGGDGRDFITVGGVSTALFQVTGLGAARADDVQLFAVPELAFVERQRGYEDLATRGQAAAIGTAAYRYRFVIDYGWASLLYLFPSIFLREIDIEAFASSSRIWREVAPVWRHAAGGAVSLRMALMGSAPVSLFYQFAYRWDAAAAPLHLVGVSIE